MTEPARWVRVQYLADGSAAALQALSKAALQLPGSAAGDVRDEEGSKALDFAMARLDRIGNRWKRGAPPGGAINAQGKDIIVFMRIGIPVNEKSMDADVCPSFGRAPYFLFHNSVTKETYFLDNAAISSQGGAGIRAAQVIADHGVQALITPRCGENAEAVLRKVNVFVYRSTVGTASDNIDALLNNRLTLLNEFHPGMHGHGK